jgi:thymidylate synthase
MARRLWLQVLTFKNFTEAYLCILEDVYTKPQFESSPRGMKVRETLGFQFKITNPRDRIPYIKERDFAVSYMVAELVYYLSGNDSIDWIANYSKFWKGISDDGLTANSAYGARIFKPHARIAAGIDHKWSQWDYIINELASDNDSRRAVIHLRSPHDSILAKLDVPCTLTLQFLLRNDKLNLVVSMRSSDCIFGLAYDVPAFTVFQELMASELTSRLGREIGLGDYIHTSNSLHIYERNFDMVEKIIINNYDTTEAPRSFEMPVLPGRIPKSLETFETCCRTTTKKEDLLHALDDVSSIEPYWYDWCLVLASHRAEKLKDKALQHELLDGCTFEGYKFFAR